MARRQEEYIVQPELQKRKHGEIRKKKEEKKAITSFLLRQALRSLHEAALAQEEAALSIA